MHLAYYDESGDDGYPKYSSPLFSLSALYIHYLNWKETYEAIREFRMNLKTTFGIPLKMEFHAKHFILNKNPYRELNLSNQSRLQITDLFCDLIANLNIKIINVVIVKPRIVKPNYDVLDTAFKYSVQRIENDLDYSRDPKSKFLIITDPGRVGKMRKIARKIQKINYIPSKFSPETYRREIKALIEDPLEKDSKESYFIQLVDLVSYIVYLYSINKTGVCRHPARLLNILNSAKIIDWMNKLKPSLNLSASSYDTYGIVFHPQN